MLNILRKKAQSTLIQALVLIIAIVFVFWGVGANLGTKRNALATVNGNEIPVEDFQRLYETTIDNLRVQFGGSVPQGLLDSLGMKQQVLNQLIQAELVRQGGRKMGINVSRLATQEEIKNMDVFQQNGQFDINRYKQILSQNRMTPTTFEASLHNDLLARSVTEAVQKFGILPEREIQARYDFANEQIRLAYAVFRAADFEDHVVVEEEKLGAWYDEQKQNYKTEPQVRLKYMFFSFDEDLAAIEIPEEEVRARYEGNQQQYTAPEQRHARHILFRISETDDAQVRADKKKKAEEVLAMAKEGKDFAGLAKQYSEGPTAQSGGDLGFFNRGAMVEQFDRTVFQMQPGDISDIVETVFGYHIIKLEAVRPEVTRSFDEVKDSIAEEMKQEKVKAVTTARARKAYEDIIRSGSLDRYSQETSTEVRKTDFFARNSPPGAPVDDPRFLQTAFTLKKGELSSLVPAGGGYAIIFVDDIQSPEELGLDAVRDQVTADYRKARSAQLAKEAAADTLQKARDAEELSVEALPGVEVIQSDFIRRTSPTEAGGLPVQLVQEAFELSPGEPFPREPLNQGDAWYVFQMLEKQQSDETLEETQRQVLAEQLAQSAKTRLLDDWIAWRQSSAEIWTNQQILQ